MDLEVLLPKVSSPKPIEWIQAGLYGREETNSVIKGGTGDTQ